MREREGDSEQKKRTGGGLFLSKRLRGHKAPVTDYRNHSGLRLNREESAFM